MRSMDKGILTNADMKKNRYRLLYAGMLLFMIAFCAVSFLPVIWVLLSGFKDVKEMYAVPPTLLPKKIELSKLVRVWNEMKFYKYYLNTFVMAGGAAVMDMVVSGLAGYVLSRLKPRGSKFVSVIIFWIMLLPGTMRTVPLYMEFKNMPILGINLLNTYWPIWFMAGTNAFNIILFKNFFDGISISLIESAWLDGCSNLKMFFKIIIPISTPVFIVVGTLTFNANIGNFFWPYLLIQKKEMAVLGIQLFNMKNSRFTMDYQMIALIFAILPQIIIFAIFQKHIIGGINVGGVKG